MFHLHLPLRRSTPAGLLIAVVLAVSACSSTSTASDGSAASSPTTSTTTSRHSLDLCSLITPQEIKATTYADVGRARPTIRKSTTECTYKAGNSSQSILIRYDTGADSSSFAADRSVFESHGQQLGPITGLGDEAYYFSESVGASTITTIVVRKGTLQIVVIGTATFYQVGALTRLVVAKADAAGATTASSSGG